MTKNSSNLPTATKATKVLINAFEAIFKPKLYLKKVEETATHPTLFVPNHFTRVETIVFPYVLYKHSQKVPRSLADASLFVGQVGDFLKNVGAVSTKQTDRNRIIIANLMTGEHNWVIYPEGSMVKSKSVVDDRGHLLIQSLDKFGPPKTGSAVLALEAELTKESLKRQLLKKSHLSHEYFNQYQVHPHELSPISLKISPVNITYYPLRPGENRIGSILEKAFSELPQKLSEEIKVESQLLLNADIHITVGHSIDIYRYTQFLSKALGFIPLSENKKIKFIISVLYKKLTQKYMWEIYRQVTINIDHLFAYYLFNSPTDVLNLDHLKYFLLKGSFYIRSHSQFNYHKSISPALEKILTQESYYPFENILNFAIKSKVLLKPSKEILGKEQNGNKENELIINRELLSTNSDFHSIRLENTLKVIYNEIKPLKRLNRVLKKYHHFPLRHLKKNLSQNILNLDLNEQKKDYEKYYDADFSKPINVGRPFYLKKKRAKLGVVLSHGYKSAPLEIAELARHLYKKNISVYGVRLKGHGTHPINIKDTTWQDWYSSYCRGLAAIRCDFSKVIVGGFSTGGTLALLAAACNPSLVDGVLSINSPLKLQDVKSKLSHAVNAWNELLGWASIEKGRWEYVDDTPEQPNINYSRNYLKGVSELEKLMRVCRDNLNHITAPTLIIQAENDPTVNPESADIIYKGVNAPKQLVKLPLDNHVIVLGEGRERVFKIVEDFVLR